LECWESDYKSILVYNIPLNYVLVNYPQGESSLRPEDQSVLIGKWSNHSTTVSFLCTCNGMIWSAIWEFSKICKITDQLISKLALQIMLSRTY